MQSESESVVAAVAGLIAALERFAVRGANGVEGRGKDSSDYGAPAILGRHDPSPTTALSPEWRQFLAPFVTPGTPYLVITERNQPSLHDFLTRALAGVETVEVLMNRRFRERRRWRRSAVNERRRADRRSRAEVDEELRSGGFAFVRRPDPPGTARPEEDAGREEAPVDSAADGVQQLLERALQEFSPEWELLSHCTRVDLFDSHHWPSGRGPSFQAVLRHQTTGGLKVLGRRTTAEVSASCHRALALPVIHAYHDGITDPIRRYLHEIGAAPDAGDHQAPRARTFGWSGLRADASPAQRWTAFLKPFQTPGTRYLVIVNRQQPSVYQSLRDTFSRDETVEVIIDRRFGERRRPHSWKTTERRQAERRGQRDLSAELRSNGFAFVRSRTSAR